MSTALRTSAVRHRKMVSAKLAMGSLRTISPPLSPPPCLLKCQSKHGQPSKLAGHNLGARPAGSCRRSARPAVGLSHSCKEGHSEAGPTAMAASVHSRRAGSHLCRKQGPRRFLWPEWRDEHSPSRLQQRQRIPGAASRCGQPRPVRLLGHAGPAIQASIAT